MLCRFRGRNTAAAMLIAGIALCGTTKGQAATDPVFKCQDTFAAAASKWAAARTKCLAKCRRASAKGTSGLSCLPPFDGTTQKCVDAVAAAFEAAVAKACPSAAYPNCGPYASVPVSGLAADYAATQSGNVDLGVPSLMCDDTLITCQGKVVNTLSKLSSGLRKCLSKCYAKRSKGDLTRICTPQGGADPFANLDATTGSCVAAAIGSANAAVAKACKSAPTCGAYGVLQLAGLSGIPSGFLAAEYGDPSFNPYCAPGVARTLDVSGLVDAAAGTVQSVTVVARDAAGNVASDYRGAVSFSTVGDAPTFPDRAVAATLPTSYGFTAADAGTHTFVGGVTLTTAGAQTVVAIDSVDASIVGAQGVTITGADLGYPSGDFFTDLTRLSAFDVQLDGGTAIQGIPGRSTMRIRAMDPFGNVASGYSGTMEFNWIIPRDFAPREWCTGGNLPQFVAISNGRGSAPADLPVCTDPNTGEQRSFLQWFAADQRINDIAPYVWTVYSVYSGNSWGNPLVALLPPRLDQVAYYPIGPNLGPSLVISDSVTTVFVDSSLNIIRSQPDPVVPGNTQITVDARDQTTGASIILQMSTTTTLDENAYFVVQQPIAATPEDPVPVAVRSCIEVLPTGECPNNGDGGFQAVVVLRDNNGQKQLSPISYLVAVTK